MKTAPRILATIATILCSQAFAAGHCAAGEETFFSCTIRGSAKVLSVCGGADWLQYRFGKQGKPELVFPSKREGSLQRFTGAFRNHRAAGVEANWLMFEQAGVAYAVTKVEGGSNFVGVTVSESATGRSKDFQCDSRKPMVSNLYDAIDMVPEGNP